MSETTAMLLVLAVIVGGAVAFSGRDRTTDLHCVCKAIALDAKIERRPNCPGCPAMVQCLRMECSQKEPTP